MPSLPTSAITASMAAYTAGRHFKSSAILSSISMTGLLVPGGRGKGGAGATEIVQREVFAEVSEHRSLRVSLVGKPLLSPIADVCKRPQRLPHPGIVFCKGAEKG